MKLLIRGGSISAGQGVSRSYVDILRDRYAPLGLEIINRSRAKDTSFDGVLSFYEDIDPFSPEFLLLHFGVDDAYSGVYRSEFKENLVRMIRLAMTRFYPVVLLSSSHPFASQEDMAAVNIYYRAMREVAEDLYCEMIFVHIYWAGYLRGNRFDHRDFVQEDERYPNERGHEIYAEAVMQRLNRFLPPEITP
jgi:hypothetical protein